MGRPIRPIVYGPKRSTLERVRKTLQPHINQLLWLANQGDAIVDAVLVAVSEGQTKVKLSGVWPEPAVLAVVNLISNVRSGDYHLKRCAGDASWMLVKKSDRQFCPKCLKARNRKYQEKFRNTTNEANRRALEDVRRKDVRRTT